MGKLKISSGIFLAFVMIIFFIPVISHAFFGLALEPVLSNSMKPVFQRGDLLFTHDVTPNHLHVGDIVVLHDHEDYSLFAHRITKIERIGLVTSLTTKGDANPTEDIGTVQVIRFMTVPHYLFRVPWLGHIIIWYSSQMGQKAVRGVLGVGILFFVLIALRIMRH